MPVDYAVAEAFSENGLGFAIMNRLRKASEGKTFRNKAQLDRLIGHLKDRDPG